MADSTQVLPRTKIAVGELEAAAGRLRAANVAFARRYSGEVAARQPVHTVYGGAQLFRSDTTTKLGEIALRALQDYAPDATTLGEALGISDHPALSTIYSRLVRKLQTEPVEDFRIDFEDGYGQRPDSEEDGHAAAVATALADGMSAGTLSQYVGIRVKPLTEELRARSLRTLDIVLSTLMERAGAIPGRFLITLPKITLLEQVEFVVSVLERMERALGLATPTLRFEVMVETPQIVLDASGRSLLPRLLDAGQGRLSSAHFGTYDYTASVGITAAHQRMQHPACDFAKQMMQVAFAGTGVWLSDGSTAVLPVPIHRAEPGATRLTSKQAAENRASIHRAWRLHYDDVRHTLVGGFYQGWDLHPAQLVTRYAALYAFFLEGLDAAAARLRNFVAKAAQATLIGDVFDDAATGQGLLNFFLRAINCGAIADTEVAERTGLATEELRQRSFSKILADRGSVKGRG